MNKKEYMGDKPGAWPGWPVETIAGGIWPGYATYGICITTEWPWILLQGETDLWVMAWSTVLDVDFRELLCGMEAQGY